MSIAYSISLYDQLFIPPKKERVRKEVIIIRRSTEPKDYDLEFFTMTNKYSLRLDGKNSKIIAKCSAKNSVAPSLNYQAHIIAWSRKTSDCTIHEHSLGTVFEDFLKYDSWLVEVQEGDVDEDAPDMRCPGFFNFVVGDHVFQIDDTFLAKFPNSKLAESINSQDQAETDTIPMIKIHGNPEDFWVLAEYLNYSVDLDDLGFLLVMRLKAASRRYRMMEISELCSEYLANNNFRAHGPVEIKTTRDMSDLAMNSYKPFVMFDNCGLQSDFEPLERFVDRRLLKVYMHVRLPLQSEPNGVWIFYHTYRGLIVHCLKSRSCSCQPVSSVLKPILDNSLIGCPSRDFGRLIGELEADTDIDS